MRAHLLQYFYVKKKGFAEASNGDLGEKDEITRLCYRFGDFHLP
jgi:hypothetical protein